MKRSNEEMTLILMYKQPGRFNEKELDAINKAIVALKQNNKLKAKLRQYEANR